jgi:hypothetical protein
VGGNKEEEEDLASEIAGKGRETVDARRFD